MAIGDYQGDPTASVRWSSPGWRRNPGLGVENGRRRSRVLRISWGGPYPLPSAWINLESHFSRDFRVPSARYVSIR